MEGGSRSSWGRTAAAVLLLLALVACTIALISNGRSAVGEEIVLLTDAARKRLSEAVSAAGKAPTPGERDQLDKILAPAAKHLATRFLFTEVAERAREHPKKPGHQAMERVLASTKERSAIEAEVKNKLVNVHSGHWAKLIYARTPAKYHKLLPALGTEAAHTATLAAFAHLKQQMEQAEKSPSFMKKLSATDPNA